MDRTLLVIDDELTTLQLYKDLLEVAGYCVVTARSGREALERLESMDPPALILLDALLPDMLGVDVMRALPERAPRQVGVPVLALSGMPADSPQGRELSPLVTRYALKPWDLQEVVDLVDAMLATNPEP